MKDQRRAIAAGRPYLSLVSAQMQLAAYTDFIGGTKRCVHARRVAQPCRTWVANCKTPNCRSHPHISQRTGEGALILTPHQSSLRANTANALTSATVRHCQR